MAQMEVWQQNLDEDERMMGTIEAGMFVLYSPTVAVAHRCISMHSDIHKEPDKVVQECYSMEQVEMRRSQN